MKIASVYGFTAFPPKGGDHVHVLQLIQQFQQAGHEVLTWGDSSVRGVTCHPRSAEGGWAMRQAADMLDLRIGGNRLAERVAGS